jgi:hypothetical protein
LLRNKGFHRTPIALRDVFLRDNSYSIPAIEQMLVFFQSSYLKILIPKVIVLRGEAFGRWLDHEGRILMNETRALIKEAQESSFASRLPSVNP